MAKYRMRTRLRTTLPFALIGLVPKGKKDCGAHEYYKSAEGLYLCYHCTVGVGHERPLDW